MTTAVKRPPAGGERDSGAQAAAATGGHARAGRRNGRRVAAGVLLVIATVVTFWQVDLRRHATDSYLAVARPVAAGQVVADADITVVRIANASGLALVPAARRADVLGRTATVPLAAGSLLTAAQLGPAAWPPAGQAVIAVPVKPGRAPASLAPGTRVVVLVTAANGTAQSTTSGDNPGSGGSGGARRASATVVSVSDGSEQAGSQLVTLLLDAGVAEQIAAASGEVSLVQLGPKE